MTSNQRPDSGQTVHVPSDDSQPSAAELAAAKVAVSDPCQGMSGACAQQREHDGNCWTVLHDVGRSHVRLYQVNHTDGDRPWCIDYPDDEEPEHLGPMPDDVTDQQLVDAFRAMTDCYDHHPVVVLRHPNHDSGRALARIWRSASPHLDILTWDTVAELIEQQLGTHLDVCEAQADVFVEVIQRMAKTESERIAKLEAQLSLVTASIDSAFVDVDSLLQGVRSIINKAKVEDADGGLSPDDCWICGEGAGHVLANCPTDPDTHPRP